MKTKAIVLDWFQKWEDGHFRDLPLTEDFRHTSPFGTIEGKAAYLHIVENNREKFLGQTFEIHDGFYGDSHACVRYTARQGADFSLDVSEWYYFEGQLIKRIEAYYHIGEIRTERQLNT